MPSSWPDLSAPAYEEAVLRVVARGVLTEGPEVVALEEEFAKVLGDGYAVAFSSGTLAIEAVLRVRGIGQGDEVICPAFSFPASAHAIIAAGASPLFADVDARTFNLDPAAARAVVTDRTAAALAVHLHGLPADAAAIPGEMILEDACQAFGARLGGRSAGLLGSGAAFSLNRFKVPQGGEGGVAVFRDAADAEAARRFRHFGIGADGTADGPGTQARLPELSAAVARVSLARAPAQLERARRAAEILTEACVASGVLIPPYVPPGAEPSWHKFRVLPVPGLGGGSRLRRMLQSAIVNVPTSVWQTQPLPAHPAFRRFAEGQDFPVARGILERSFLIGREDRPLCSFSRTAAERYAEEIVNIWRTI